MLVLRSRRLLTTLLILLLTAFVTLGASAAEVQTKEVSYEVDGVNLKGYLAWSSDQEGERPGVIVVHEWWGHNEYARKRARMLAELGYTAFALDMYGDGKITQHPAEAQQFAMEVAGNLDTAVARFNAAREILESHVTTNREKTAAIGYCFGGSVVLHMARIGSDLDGVASFHGGLGPLAAAKEGGITARLLVMNGAADPTVPPEQVDAFKKEMADAGADLKFIDYPGAVHAFTNPDATAIGKEYSLPLAYDADADSKSWHELVTFLKEIFED